MIAAGAMVLEPIPAYSAMLMAVRMARFPDENVVTAIAKLEAKAKGCPSSDHATWAEVYRAALEVMAGAIAAQERIDKQIGEEARRVEAARSLASLGPALAQELQKETNEWQARLTTQVGELEQKVAKSIAALPVTSQEDKQQGHTVFEVEAGQLASVRAWFEQAVGAWWANNEQLVAIRAREALAPVLQGAAEFDYEVAPMASAARPTVSLEPKGHTVLTPGRFEAVGATYKYVMSIVMGASAVGFMAKGVQISGAGEAIKWGSLVVLVGAVVAAAITIPAKQKQARMRLLHTATQHVRDELRQLMVRELGNQKNAQLQALRKHLGAEARRASQLLRAATGASAPDGLPKARMPMGLMPQDVQRLKGEWKVAVEQRLAELQG